MPPDEFQKQVEWGIAAMLRETGRKIDEWFASGPFVNEVHVDYEPPSVELRDDCIVITEHLRFL